MKKALTVLAVLCAAVFLLSVRAEAVDVEAAQREALDIGSVEDGAPSDAAGLLEGIDVENALTEGTSWPKRLAAAAAEAAKTVFSDAAQGAAGMLAAAALCSAAKAVCGDSEGLDYIAMTGVTAVAAISAGRINALAGLGASVIGDMSAFSKLLMPVLAAASAASGSVSGAAAKYAVCALFTDILLTAAEKLVTPLIYAYIALSVASAALGEGALDGAARLIKWITGVATTLLATAFSLYLTVTSILTNSADAAAARLTKTAVSTVLPVVGGVVSDAAAAVAGSMAALRNAVGAFGIMAASAMCLLPFLKLTAHYVIYKAAAALVSCMAQERISKAASAIGSAFGMLLGLAAVSALMLFVGVISVMRAVI